MTTTNEYLDDGSPLKFTCHFYNDCHGRDRDCEDGCGSISKKQDARQGGIAHRNKEIPDKKVDLATKRKSLFFRNTVQQKTTEKIHAQHNLRHAVFYV